MKSWNRSRKNWTRRFFLRAIQAGENALKRQQLENQIEVLNEQIHASERNSDTLRERLEAIRAESRTKTAEKKYISGRKGRAS